MAANYREGYNLFAVNGILFNHESPRRGETFVTRKITRGIAAILAEKANISIWGTLMPSEIGDFPRICGMMWKMLQAELRGLCCRHGRNPFSPGIPAGSVQIHDLRVDEHVRIDPRYFRPTEVDVLIADAKKIKRALKWTPKITFKDLVKIMLDADLRLAGLEPPGEGDAIIAEKIPEEMVERGLKGFWGNRD